MATYRAHTAKSATAKLVAGLAPMFTVVIVSSTLFEGVDLTSVSIATATMALGGVVTWWALKRSRDLGEVRIDDHALTLVGRGRHILAPRSLFAIRAPEHGASGSTMGTVIVVKLDTGATVQMLFGLALSNELHLHDGESHADLWFDPDANALLNRLLPHVARRDGAQAHEAYTFMLRRQLLSPGRSADSLTVAGDEIVLISSGAVVDRARAHVIAFSRFRFERGQSSDLTPSAPAVMLTFPSTARSLTIGAAPMTMGSHFRDWPEGKAPERYVGFGELMRLIDVLERARAR